MKKEIEEAKIHIHKVVSEQKTTYDRAYEKYHGMFDEKGMIAISDLTIHNQKL
jgi:hypothetical protein